MKYQAKPVIVEAYQIAKVELPVPFCCATRHICCVHDLDPQSAAAHLTLSDGEVVTVSRAMTARLWPQVGDYWVKQEDGYVYLNPKAVFERKYSPIP